MNATHTEIEIVQKVAAAQRRDWESMEQAVQSWLVANKIELDARTLKRFKTRVFVKHGADFPWHRLTTTQYVTKALEWARSGKRW